MPHYQGSCHCGAVRFAYEGETIERGLRCNCSICARKGAMMSSEIIPPERLHIEAREGTLGLYQFGAATARHFFCRECGIYPFHQTARKPDHYRVNLGCVEGVDTFALECDLFDGKHLL
ncbi:MAG: aldehyde-activating protein [Candidatus Sedimenticola endophacoides]|uniref:Aldehyde-activating protein n=1 Tax=Candidatus Sedimenticola endophacoides TaxID=2548426 RepID=A0A657PU19_9GAMM|nr:MAG: aldehyde-activating protein [Candidatus Sedimenticola endophacoides]OQX32557.1 MAG: aldehyde-activating protein [Candidatus Sedimenticola endophacoides]OQX35104.1 MAG: aldehyde-activating protein [Candidatus Sedimenticola endophacoides]OQX40598.1 MAG: aldehyde-activating protein [Candidatus Sedimenticola endophacoides]OQX43342.1 MAG: aldehyde-activating protein [Candidatus Sedimenticola endophacoides]